MTGEGPGVLAHFGGPGEDWPVLPLAVLGLAALGHLCLLAYTAPRGRPTWLLAGRGAAGLLGLVALGAALASPLERLGEESLAAHMAQHLLLTLVAAPLLVLADPVPRLMTVLPAPVRSAAGRPWARLVRWAQRPAAVLGAAAGYLAVVLAWHVPVAYEAAVRSTPVHVAEHVTFLGAALVFWWCLLRVPRRRTAPLVAGVVAVLLVALVEALLGAAMLLSPSPWYGVYVATAAERGVDPMVDQQVAGAIMWTAGMPVYLLALAVLLWRVVRSGTAESEGPVPSLPAEMPGGHPIVGPPCPPVHDQEDRLVPGGRRHAVAPVRR